MFREMERKNKEITREKCIEVLKSETRGVLCVLGDDDYPYGTPLNHYYDEESGNIYFHTGTQKSHRTDSLKKHSKVTFCCYDKGYKKSGHWAYNVNSVIVFGKITVIEAQDRIAEITKKLSHKFTHDEDYIEKEIEANLYRTQLLELKPEHISGKLITEA